MPLWWFAFCLYIYILLQLLTAFDENAAESISISEFQIFPLLSIFIFSEVSSIMVGPDLSGKPKYQFGNMSLGLVLNCWYFNNNHGFTDNEEWHWTLDSILNSCNAFLFFFTHCDCGLGWVHISGRHKFWSRTLAQERRNKKSFDIYILSNSLLFQNYFYRPEFFPLVMGKIMKIIKTQVSNLLEKFHFNAKINGSFIYTIFGKLIGMNKDIIFQF